MPIKRTLHFADVHLESDAVSTKDTIKGVWHIIHSVEPSTLDIISFSGDTFDKAMVVPASKIALVIAFGGKLLDYCEKHDIYLRFLEGTTSHDRGQPSIFVDLAKIKGLEHRVTYHDQLELVRDPVTDLNVLYVPDEINHDNTVTLEQAKALLKKNGLSKVDMISMHGAFKYQVGLILTRPHHIEAPWINLCKYYIVCGHVHGHSTYGNTILIPSSTNRTAHNEERAKGAILTTINTDTGEKEWEFIENIYATIFVTLDLRDKTLKEVQQTLNELTYPKGSNVRLLINKESDVLKSFAQLKRLYPDLKLKRKVADEKSKDEEEVKTFKQEVKGVSVTYKNLNSLFINHLSPDTEGLEGLNELLTLHVERCRDGIRSR